MEIENSNDNDNCNDEIISDIERLTDIQVLKDEPMKKHTSFRIGGPSDIFVEVNSVSDLKKILDIAKKHDAKVYIIGNGTNILVRDNGIRGIVIKMGLDSMSITNDGDDYFLNAYAGASLVDVIKYAIQNGLGSVSNLYGIPGSLGGAVYMNAGAFGTEMKDVVCETTYMDYDGNIHNVKNCDSNFGYRDSIFKHNDGIILSAKLRLKKVDENAEREKAEEIMKRRRSNQPLEYPSAGSTFKRGDDFVTSLLIDEAGLKGKSVGGAEVSEKHAGFLINKTGDATAKDVLDLVKIVQDEVKQNSGKDIELEVLVIGE